MVQTGGSREVEAELARTQHTPYTLGWPVCGGEDQGPTEVG